jgi:hypothetical protein
MRIFPIGFLLLSLLFSCGSSISEEEFVKQFQVLSNNRNNFKKSLKALGDSSYVHQNYASMIWQEVTQDSAFEKQIEPSYKAYNDSLRRVLDEGQSYFKTQFSNTKPFIRHWEQLDMRFDQTVEAIKKAELSESEGLDSLKLFGAQMSGFVKKADSLERAATMRYWEFRKTYQEFQYNQVNLKIYYAGKK